MSEAEARNTLSITYDERGAFALCAASLTPIVKGAPSTKSPFSGAAYHPQHKGSLCVIDGLAQVGVETLGLVCTLQKGPQSRR